MAFQDPQTLADQITQQQHMALADAIRKQSMEQSPTEYAAGGRAVVQSPLIGLSKLAQALIANRFDKSNRQERMDMANDANTRLFAALRGDAPSQTGTPQPAPDTTMGGILPQADSTQIANAPSEQPTSAPQSSSFPNQQTNTPFNLGNLLRGNAINQIGGDGASGAYWKQTAPEKTELERQLDLMHNTTNPADKAIISNKISPPVVNRGYGLLTTNLQSGELENNQASMEGISLAKQREADVANANTLVTKKNEQGKDVTKTQAQWLNEANSGQGVTTGAGTVQQKLQEEQGKSAAAQEDKINLDAETALGKMANNKQMRLLLPDLTTGAFSKQVTAAKSVLQSMGITPTDESGNIIDPSTNQEFEKYAIKGALESAKQIYGSRLTNQDVENQLKSNPGSTMSQKAMYQILKNDDLLQQRKLDAQHAYFNEYTGAPNQFQMWFDQRHPLNGLSAPTSNKPAAETAYSPPIPDLTQPKINVQKNPKLKANPDGSFNYQH